MHDSRFYQRQPEDTKAKDSIHISFTCQPISHFTQLSVITQKCMINKCVPTKKEHNDKQTIIFQGIEVFFHIHEILGLNLGDET